MAAELRRVPADLATAKAHNPSSVKTTTNPRRCASGECEKRPNHSFEPSVLINLLIEMLMRREWERC